MSDTAGPIPAAPDAAPSAPPPAPAPAVEQAAAAPPSSPAPEANGPATIIDPQRQRGPDGRFAASPPPPAAATQAPAAVPAAPAEAQRPVRDMREYARQQYEALTRNTATPAGTDAPAPPGPQISSRDPASTVSPAQSGLTPVFNPPAPAPAPAPAQPDPLAEYAGTMTKRTAELLKSVNMLPSAADWAGMDVDERQEHVETVKEYRRNYHRQYEQQRRGTTPVRQANDESDSGLPPATRAVQDGIPGQPGGDLGQLPQPVRERLAALAREVDESSPIYQAQLATALHYETQLRQERVTRQQAAVENRFRQAEDAAFAKLREAIPQVGDPTVVEDLRPHCRAYASSWAQQLQAQGYGPAEINQRVTAEAVIARVARAQFSQEIQQRERERLDLARQRSLAQSAERGVARPAPPAPLNTPREKARQQFEQLRALADQGVDGRAALLRIAAG